MEYHEIRFLLKNPVDGLNIKPDGIYVDMSPLVEVEREILVNWGLTENYLLLIKMKTH
jgi:hypothetical protein